MKWLKSQSEEEKQSKGYSMALIDEIKAKAKLYLAETDDEEVISDEFVFPTTIADFVLEYAYNQCHFPQHFSKLDKEKALENHVSSIAMACADVYLKIGFEGQKEYSSNGYQRVFKSEWITPSLLSNLPNYVNTI